MLMYYWPCKRLVSSGPIISSKAICITAANFYDIWWNQLKHHVFKAFKRAKAMYVWVKAIATYKILILIFFSSYCSSKNITDVSEGAKYLSAHNSSKHNKIMYLTVMWLLSVVVVRKVWLLFLIIIDSLWHNFSKCALVGCFPMEESQAFLSCEIGLEVNS